MHSDDELKTVLSRISQKGQKPPPQNGDDESESLAFGEMNGEAMRPANKSLMRLHIVHADGKIETLYYCHMDAKSEFNGGSFKFIFAGAKMWELTVEGRKLWRMYDYISLGRWPYIRVSPRDFDKDGEVVTAVTIKDISPRYDE